MENIIIGLIALTAGAGGTFALLRFVNKRAVQEAEAEAKLLKKNKLIENKEKFIALKAEHEQQVQERNAKIQTVEVRLQQKELQLNQKQGDVQRKINEVDAQKEHLELQLSGVDVKKKELEHLHHQALIELETVSGLSADQAKERLIDR